MAIAAKVSNTVALSHPQTQERGRKPVSAFVELSISESILAAHDADFAAIQSRHVPLQPDGG